MKRMKLFPVLFAVLMLFVFATPAIAPPTELNSATCGSILYGSWSGSTCTVGISLNVYSVITIPSGTTLNIMGGLAIAGITNSGTISNDGSLGSEAITNIGTIINSGSFLISDTLTNSGTITNNIYHRFSSSVYVS